MFSGIPDGPDIASWSFSSSAIAAGTSSVSRVASFGWGVAGLVAADGEGAFDRPCTVEPFAS